jgi:hypothetical protein
MSSDKGPAPDAGSDDGGNGQPQIVVNDPEDFAETRQLRSIFDARDDYIQARRDANDAHEAGKMSFSKMNSCIFRYVQDFAMAAEPLLLSHDAGQELWEEQQYGVESNFVEQSELASLDEGLKLLENLADEVIDEEVTPQNLRFLADSVNVELSRSQIETVIDTIQKQNQPQSTSNVTSSVQTLDDIREMDADRLQQAAKQSEQSQQQNPSVDTSQLVETIYRVKDASGGHMTTGNDKFEYKLRIQATDWGWQTTGIKSLVRQKPRLAYAVNGKSEFGKTNPPQVVSNDVFRDIQLFLDDIGLGITFDSEQQTKITDELLEEVDAWRRENT